jgi:nitrogen regulatory protein PII
MSLQLLLIVLNKVEKLDDLLETFLEEGYSGATIINSTGMISKMAKHMENYPIFGSLRFLVDFDREENITIFMALKDEQVESVKKIVRNVIGDLSQPNTAVMFTLPILSVEGIDI